LAVLAAALEDALDGRGQMVMIGGDPGIGKTRLAQELASHARSSGVQVFWGWCYEHAGAPPYWPYVQPIRNYVESADAHRLTSQMASGGAAIAEIIPELRERLPELGRLSAAEPEQARFRLFDSVATFLKNVSQEQPLLFLIDDLHWSDDSSLLLLEFLAREIAASPVLIVGTYRDVEVTGEHLLNRILGNLARENHCHRMQLGGLTQPETRELVEAGSGVAVEEDAVSSLYRRTEGNPLFVGEVVAAVGLHAITRDSNWTASIPTAIRGATVRRLSRLSEPCKQLLRTASVVGRDFDIQLLRDLSTDIPENEFLEGLDEALGIGVVESSPARPGRYQFCHALIEQAVYEEISPIGKARAHAAVGETLEGLHRDNLGQRAGELAYHFAEAVAVSGTEKIVRYSLIAGERALDSFAYEQALTHFNQVLEVKEGQADDAEVAAAFFGLGRAQAATLSRANLAVAFASLSRAFDFYAGTNDVTRAVAVASYPMQHLPGLRITGDLVSRALKLIPPDSLEAGRLLCSNVQVLGLEEGNYEGAMEAFDSAMSIAQRRGDAELEMRTLGYSSWVDYWHLNWQETVVKGSRAIELAREARDQSFEVSARFWVGYALLGQGEIGEAQFQASAALAAAESLRDRYWLRAVLWLNELAFIYKGDWPSAKVFSDRGLSVSPSDTRLLASRLLVEYETGNAAGGQAYLDQLIEALQLDTPGPRYHQGATALTIPLVARITGKEDQLHHAEIAAASVLAAEYATPQTSNLARLGFGLIAVLRGDVEAAKKQYASLGSIAGSYFVGISGDRELGLLAQTMGDLEQAVTHFENCVAGCRNTGNRPELAWACHDYADALLSEERGRAPLQEAQDKASSLLEEALDISTELGMAPLRERVEALEDRIKLVPVPAPAIPGGMTRREVEVLTQLAQGKTDREIARELGISDRTVQRHISNIYAKINVRNRAEATTFALNHLSA
jgi:DNA-binding CsgD family transcriptional regulator